MIQHCATSAPALIEKGYWNNSHTKFQLEDVADCVSFIYPEFDFMYNQNSDRGAYSPSPTPQPRRDVLPERGHMDPTAGWV